jgi:hypothetical protein
MKTFFAVIGLLCLFVVISYLFLILLMPKWHQKAAERGNANAQFVLGMMYRDGRGVLKDDVKAMQWIKKAAEQGYAEAQFRLGIAYLLGQGVAHDRQAGCDMLRASAGQETTIETIAVFYDACIANKADIAKDELEKRLNDEMAKFVKSAEAPEAKMLKPPMIFPGRGIQAGE